MASNNQLVDSGAIPVRLSGANVANGGNQTAIGGTIATANTYQQIAAAGQALHGGQIENSSAAGTGTMFLDFTSGVTSGAAANPSAGACELGARQSTTQPGGKQVIPPTTNAVFVYGPAGSTFRGWVS